MLLGAEPVVIPILGFFRQTYFRQSGRKVLASQDQHKPEKWRTVFSFLTWGMGLSHSMLDTRVLHLPFSEEFEPPFLYKTLEL